MQPRHRTGSTMVWETRYLNSNSKRLRISVCAIVQIVEDKLDHEFEETYASNVRWSVLFDLCYVLRNPYHLYVLLTEPILGPLFGYR